MKEKKDKLIFLCLTEEFDWEEYHADDNTIENVPNHNSGWTDLCCTVGNASIHVVISATFVRTSFSFISAVVIVLFLFVFGLNLSSSEPNVPLVNFPVGLLSY